MTIQNKIEEQMKEFDEYFSNYNLFELPIMVNEVRGSVKTMGDKVIFYNGRYLPKEHIKKLLT